MKLLLILSVLLTVGCSNLDVKPPEQTSTTPITLIPAPVILAWGDKHPDWDKALKEEIAKNDWSVAPNICKKLSKESCVAQLMSKMAQYESSFNPSEVYHEPPPLGVDSIGLFQLSIESEKTLCSLTSKEQLKDPIINIKCAVKVLYKWTARDKVLYGGKKGAWLGGSRYWSVLRTTSGSYPKIIKYMETF